MTGPDEWTREPAAPTPPVPPQPVDAGHAEPRRRPVPLLVIALIVVLAAVVATVAWRKLQPGDFTMHGTMSLVGVDNFTSYGDNQCAGSDGYDDLRIGAQVVVTDDAGKTVAVGALQDSRNAGDQCRFSFDVQGVPSGRRFYGVTVSHRGVVQFSQQEAKAGPGLTIGSDS